MLDEVEQPRVRPVDVLQHQDEGVARGHALEESTPRVEEVLAAERTRLGGAHQHPDLESDGLVAEQLLHGRVGLRRRRLDRVVLQDLALRLDRVGQGRVAGTAVGEAAPAPPVDDLGERLHVRVELRGEPSLADTGGPDDRDERRPPFSLHAMEGLRQHRQLLVASNQPGAEAQLRSFASLLRSDPEGVPCGDGVCLTFEVERRQFAILDDLLRRCVRAGTHDDMAGLRGRLEPGGGVDRVAREHPVARSARALEVDQYLAGLDADPHGELGLPLGGEGAVHLREHGLHLVGGANGSFGVVLVRPGHAEHGEYGVAHELLQEPFVTLNDLGEAIERAPHDGLDDLGVLLLGEGGRAHQVGEERRRVLALLAAGLGRERGPAVQAEPRPLGVLLAAGRAGDHRPSVDASASTTSG